MLTKSKSKSKSSTKTKTKKKKKKKKKKKSSVRVTTGWGFAVAKNLGEKERGKVEDYKSIRHRDRNKRNDKSIYGDEHSLI